jgi:DNA helicase-2/ATP-dependent DNA helicase PcrA
MVPLDWMDALSVGAAGEPAPGSRDGVVAGLLSELNEPQREAVVHEEGPLLILAGAGSGKTRVITRRIAWLVATGRARPQEILAITFTNKAAKEMRSRVEELLPVEGMWVSTFHAMCARILRRDIEVLGSWTRDYTIYDTQDKNRLIKTITKDLGYDTKHYRPAMLGGWISEWKTDRFDRTEEVGDSTGADLGEKVFVQVRDRYEKAMRENNALDFDDLLVRVLEIFEAEPGVRDSYAHRFRYVLVDEYQDTNRIQYLLTRHLSDAHKNLAVCGDPDQSIYAWRGADVRNILDFERDFGQRAGRAVRVVKLERNFRST